MSDKKQVIVITGATSGIGLSTALLLVKEGFTVYGVARKARELPFPCISCDVTDAAAFSSALAAVYEKEGRIDALINNAGMGISGAAEYISEADSQRLFAVNTLAALSSARAAIPYLKETQGKLLFTSSVAAVIPIPFQAAYSSSKAAINYYALSLREEIKPFKIKVSVVMPGDTKTGFTDARVKTETEEGYASRVSKSVGRMEKDERGGKDPATVARVFLKLLKSKNPPPLVTVGFGYKLIVFLKRLLPQRLIQWVVSKLYA